MSDSLTKIAGELVRCDRYTELASICEMDQSVETRLVFKFIDEFERKDKEIAHRIMQIRKQEGAKR